MDCERLLLGENDWVPNNERLPVIVYRAAVGQPRLQSSDTVAAIFEALFRRHGWSPAWRDGVYDFHHYHSTAHEALGVAGGIATLELGGPGGAVVDLAAGDAVMLPAGTGHRCIHASDDFLVVGAYPHGQGWDICRAAPDAAALERIRALPDPESDPVLGLTTSDLSVANPGQDRP